MPTTEPTGPLRKWTPAELRVLAIVAADYGWEYAERYASRHLQEAQPFMDD